MNTPTPTLRTCGELSGDECNNRTAAITAERDSIKQEIELVEHRVYRAEAEVERLRSDRDCEKRLRKDADEFRENAIARAERAEADAAAYFQRANSFSKIGDEAEAELATERARLDWLESPAGMDWQWQAGITRATIDAKMQEDAK